ncbi:MAG: glycosyltransferase family 9 protein [Bacteroidaceae bacterium]|nr:glycosyltransferase family 9 protein [Bacteroidaceae bacterium]
MVQTNKKTPKNVLIIRFSAIGDVVMMLPIVHSVAEAYPNTQFTVLSQKRFAPVFAMLPANVTFMGVDLKHDYNGMAGINKLYNELKEKNFDAVANLHGVLRTNILSAKFALGSFTKVRSIKKRRLQRQKLTRKFCKNLTPQLPTTEKYKSVLQKLGFNFNITFKSIFGNTKGELSQIEQFTGKKECHWIGIAPFAAHKGKIYPLEKMEKVVAELCKKAHTKVFLFAYGKEQEQIKTWTEKYPSITIVGGQLNMQEELILMSHLDVMLAMDSSNTHLASVAGTRVVSIWGATHPAAGFAGYGQKESDSIQADLACRPCSIYGKKPCRYGDYRCLNSINPETVIEKITNGF